MGKLGIHHEMISSPLGFVVQTVLVVNEPVRSNQNIPGHFRWFWNFLETSISLEKCCQIGISLRSIMFWVSWDIYRSPQAINISKPRSFIYLSWQGNKDANDPICPEFFFRKLSPRQTQVSTIQEVLRILYVFADWSVPLKDEIIDSRHL